MTINIFMYIYIGENAHWDIYAPPLENHYTKFFFNFFNFFFHFRCILLQISHKKCFFISISILGRSGVKALFVPFHHSNLHSLDLSWHLICKFSSLPLPCWRSKFRHAGAMSRKGGGG